MKKNTTNKQIRATAKQEVAEVLAVEEAPKQKEKMEELVEGYKTELNDLGDAKAAVEDENKALSDENETLRTEKKALEDKVAELEKEISGLKATVEETEKAKQALETKLSDMEQDIAAQKRLHELEEAGITTLSDKMKARIKKMDDEEFAEYKGEFVSLKAELEKKASETSTDKTTAAMMECNKCGAKFSSKSGSKCPKCGSTDVSPMSGDDSTQDSGGEQEEDLEDPKMTAAQLLKLRKQIAALNVATGGDGLDEFGISPEMKKEYDGMWDDDKEGK